MTINKRRKKIFYLFLLLCVSCSDSPVGFVEYNYNAEELNYFLKKKTRKAKALYFFDIKCGQCSSYLSKYYPKMKEKYGDRLIYIFITTDTTTNLFLQKYLIYHGISSGYIIHLRPNINHLILIDEEKIDLNTIFLNMIKEDIIIDFTGYPTSAILNNGRIKLQKTKNNHQNTKHYQPVPWHDLLSQHLTSNDFYSN